MSLLLEVYEDFQASKERMMSPATSTVDALKLQAVIGLLEPLVRHVSCFARENPAYAHIDHMLTAEFVGNVKQQRLEFVR